MSGNPLRRGAIEAIDNEHGGVDKLDALLDYLEENAEQWVAVVAAPREEWDEGENYDSMIRAMSRRERKMLAALRVGPTKEEQ